jgi:type I restriction enzyme S subunit
VTKQPWKDYALGDLAQFINGRAFKSKDWSKSGLPIVRIQNLTDRTKPFNHFDGDVQDKHLIDDGDLLVSWSATLGSYIWNRGPAVLNQHIFKVIPLEALVHKEFLHYLILNALDEMADHAHGIAMKHITKKKFEALQVSVPELEEQQRIVDRINECMERVCEIEQLRKKSVMEHQALETALYGPVYESQKWPLMSIGELAISTRNGKSIKPTNQNSNGYVLGLGAVRSINLDDSVRKSIVLPSEILKKYSVRKNDVFVSRSNSRDLVGLSSIAKNDVDNCIYPDLLIKVTPNEDFIHPRFLAYVLRTPSVRSQIKDRASGTSQSMVKISGARLKEIVVRVPPLATQASLISKFDELHDVARNLSSDLGTEEIGLLRESVIRRAFSGEL